MLHQLHKIELVKRDQRALHICCINKRHIHIQETSMFTYCFTKQSIVCLCLHGESFPVPERILEALQRVALWVSHKIAFIPLRSSGSSAVWDVPKTVSPIPGYVSWLSPNIVFLGESFSSFEIEPRNTYHGFRYLAILIKLTKLHTVYGSKYSPQDPVFKYP